MARPVYPYEMSDPDFVWLIDTFQENRPGYLLIQESCLPILLLPEVKGAATPPFACGEFQVDDPIEQLLLPEPDAEGQLDEQ